MVKRINKQKLYAVLCALSAASLITANLSAIKTESFFGLTLGGGIITIVVDYVASDMAAEVYGFKKALRLRLLAMACNIYAVLLLGIVAIVPAAPEFTLERAFDSIFILTYALKIVVEVIVFPLITRHVIAWAKTLD